MLQADSEMECVHYRSDCFQRSVASAILKSQIPSQTNADHSEGKRQYSTERAFY